MSRDVNVLGEPLTPCCHSPKTGFYRDGFCRIGPEDAGIHAICAIMTEEFLAYFLSQGNDLSTPKPQFGFPGLSSGDRWCLCASRWQQAANAGVAPPVILSGTHARALEVTTLALLRQHALDLVY